MFKKKGHFTKKGKKGTVKLFDAAKTNLGRDLHTPVDYQ